MKILELTNYSSGICGVWNRVKEESTRLSKEGYEVRVFSSNFEKGTDKIVENEDKIGNVKITRFPAKKLGGESFLKWDFVKEAIKFKPDIIIAHSYRHRHTLQALKIKEKIGCRVILVTHAPFVDKKIRGAFQDKIVRFFDNFFGKKILNSYDKVIAITEWEIPILKRIGLEENKIKVIGNGIPEEFFKQKYLKKKENGKKILFLGRISPIKNLEVLLEAISLVKDKKVKIEIVGPAEKDYLIKLKKIVNKLDIKSKVQFSEPIYDLKEKIRKIDSCDLFVLPSKREAMPQSLIEAMARQKIVVSSENEGSSEIIKNGKNGYLFENGSSRDLAKKIEVALNESKKIEKEARKSVEKYSWNKVIAKIQRVISP